MEKKDVSECPDCASHNIVYSEAREQIICHDCGLIFEPFQAVEKITAASQVSKLPVKLKQRKEVKRMAAKKKKSSKKKSSKKSSKKKSSKKKRR